VVASSDSLGHDAKQEAWIAEAEESAHDRLRDDGVWVTRDGREIDVKDMSDEHIRNAMATLKQTPPVYWIMDEELRRRAGSYSYSNVVGRIRRKIREEKSHGR